MPTFASCWTSNGAGGAGVGVFDGAFVDGGVGRVAVGVGFAEDGVAAGVGAGGEVVTFGLAAFPLRGVALARPVRVAGAAGLAGELAAVDAGWLLDAGGWVPAADGWLLVQAASMNASARIELAQAAGPVRSRLPIWPG